ncbi:hypothetical protein GHA01_22200 [Novacetimonas hansenii]|uniref:Uncharacterized protein n=1 Tax=Novacetimonas hansenii TaxID=436 RepID=A0ABQ0SGG2_NOVHA|nr:hypothetical protein Gaha_0363_016 [Novacetimonas hansenii JCM 7643]GEC64371.1 hypothetical protein GHA01_22200 [Novacetimonas hansenii]
MADRDRDARRAQACDIGAFGDVGPLYRVTQHMQHLGNAGHADAAYADKVDGANGKGQGSHYVSVSVFALPD